MTFTSQKYNKYRICFINNKKGSIFSDTPFLIICQEIEELHHSTHAAHSGSRHSGQEHACDRGCIFQSYTSYLSRVNNACCKEIFIGICTGVVSKVSFSVFNLLNNNSTFHSGISGNLAKRFFYGSFYNFNTCRFIFICSLLFSLSFRLRKRLQYRELRLHQLIWLNVLAVSHDHNRRLSFLFGL